MNNKLDTSEITSENEWYVYNGVPFDVDMKLLVPKFLSEETINGVYVRSYE